ncbi:MAG: L-aspartate oxidase [Candidatus Melainabacteria bacterium RIFCSPHIGHO2_02_FULL_34_12]|nr:MAG: L-aspartate oxidase [Candidatus Melainabacteria bacterium RIFCSPHIGHO2_02_FULL_34_12]
MQIRFKPVEKFDVVIIGSGISGLICAIELSVAGKSVCIFTKEAVTESSSLYAQGGIAIPLSTGDSFERHLQDTLKAGTSLCNVSVAREIIKNSILAYEKLISYGIRFDLTDDAIPHLTKEAAHSFARVCHIGGDASGRFITKALIDKACRESNVSISQGTAVIRLLKNEFGRINGVLACDVTGNKYSVFAGDVIIASGGAGRLFKLTTNPQVSTGDGIALAYSAGAYLQDMEMIQFHPTVMHVNGEPLLITEAIRGEGARLKNIKGEYFATSYHKMGELAPRDVLSRAILSEIEKIEKAKSGFVYLDISSFNKEYFKTRFPTVYQACIEREVDLFGAGIPVAPAAHYLIGGIKTDLYGKTNIPGLWALGEIASNGFHGANRLASNSLLECVVVPHLLVESLLTQKELNLSQAEEMCSVEFDENQYDDNDIENILNELQLRNLNSLGLVRNERLLREHKFWLHNLSEKYYVDKLGQNIKIQEFKNMILLSNLICTLALERRHSLGVHFRQDYPALAESYKHSLIAQNFELTWEEEKSQVTLCYF